MPDIEKDFQTVRYVRTIINGGYKNGISMSNKLCKELTDGLDSVLLDLSKGIPKEPIHQADCADGEKHDE